MEFIKHVPPDLKLLLVHDEDDSEVSITQPRAMVRVFPTASLLVTKGLGHNRILKDEKVIEQIVTFIAEHSSTN
jgi:hypothetical protein